MTRSGGSLQARRLSRSAGSTPLLHDVDVSIDAGRMLGIIGPNGSGKSTLVRCLAGVAKPDAGTVSLDGQTLEGLGVRDTARRLAFVGQAEQTDIDHRVQDVVRLGRLPHRGRFRAVTAIDDAVCETALAVMGLTGFGDRRWSGLSGGERQRAHIARALAQEPTVLILDEPLNHLDVHHQFELFDVLAALPATVVVVLHDVPLAARYCDELVVLDRGRTVAAGTPADVLTPRLLADVFQVRGTVTVGDDKEVRVELRGSRSDRAVRARVGRS